MSVWITRCCNEFHESRFASIFCAFTWRTSSYVISCRVCHGDLRLLYGSRRVCNILARRHAGWILARDFLARVLTRAMSGSTADGAERPQKTRRLRGKQALPFALRVDVPPPRGGPPSLASSDATRMYSPDSVAGARGPALSRSESVGSAVSAGSSGICESVNKSAYKVLWSRLARWVSAHGTAEEKVTWDAYHLKRDAGQPLRPAAARSSLRVFCLPGRLCPSPFARSLRVSFAAIYLRRGLRI